MFFFKFQSENIQLNPEMFHACKKDIDTHCVGVPPGGAQVRIAYLKLINSALFFQNSMIFAIKTFQMLLFYREHHFR